MSTPEAKTTQSYWDSVWSAEPRLRLPSRLNVGVWDLQRLLRRHVRPGSRILEIGFAPGKLLAWVAHSLNARVTGIDYSDVGITHARKLFGALGIAGDLRQEDVFAPTVPDSTFDLVYSIGVIEHFDDPREIVTRHIRFAARGGRALIVVPNYGGLYRRLQQHFDPANLLIHNLTVMRPDVLQSLVPADLCRDVRAYRFGRMSPWLVNLHRRWPRSLSTIASLIVNGVGLIQPVDIAALSPFLVLEVTRI